MKKTRERVYTERRRLNVLVERAEYEALRRLAAKQHITMSRLARLAVLEVLNRYGEHL